jgi:AraC-like DNA-binding protein
LHVQVEVSRRDPGAALRPHLLGAVEGWRQLYGEPAPMREVPFPGVPVIFNLGDAWHVEDPGAGPARRDSFVAGLHTSPTIVHAAASWECIELRLTPLGARRILGLPMHELANRTIDAADVLPGSGELAERLHASRSWDERFDLVESFLTGRLVDAKPAVAGVEWAWQRLRTTGGRAAIRGLADELGWSHRRLIARFREQIGLTPKAAARVLRFDRAVRALVSSRTGELAAIAYDCGYFDQAHLNRDFRDLAGTTPTDFLRSRAA